MTRKKEMQGSLIAHGVAAAGVAAVLAALLILAPISPGTSSSYLPTTGVAQTASGLELHLSLNATSIASGQSISVTVWMYNPSSSTANVSASRDWALGGLVIGPCGPLNYPMGFLIMGGNLTISEVMSGQALQLYSPGTYNCPMILSSISGYAFEPTSSSASVMGSCTSSACFSADMSASATFSGDYGLLGFSSFAPGSYTVVGGDEWGGLMLLHFSVTSQES
jgi:hypothetical protein